MGIMMLRERNFNDARAIRLSRPRDIERVTVTVK
jgi:hypothetical protein